MAPATASTSTTSTLALLTPGLVVKNPRLVSKLTGRGSAGKTDERWNVVGTDLGISFEMDGRINMVFGDTWGRDGVEGAQWRTSTLGIVERHPEAGYIVTDMLKGADGNAKELISALKKPKEEYTAVPTSAIAFGGRMYIHYMLVKDWEEQWWGYKIPVVNGSGFAFSDDMGNTWTKHETARWIGNSPYAMVSMVEHEGNIYVFGTGASRFGPLKLFRVPGEQLLEYDRYEYWNGAAWTREPAEAAEVVGWPVGELSVRWSEYHEKWLMMYLNEVTHNIVLRTADSLTGPWGDERPVVHSDDYHSLYGPLMLPHIEGSDVYFAMSTFYGDYNVFIMKLTLEPATTTVP
ncbi:MAG: DUF4185 domain-containing protein [SAR202 cluster bacterium]|nr:DUF4185 domain-containing protein [SAR202 cluster bacterium]